MPCGVKGTGGAGGALGRPGEEAGKLVEEVGGQLVGGASEKPFQTSNDYDRLP